MKLRNIALVFLLSITASAALAKPSPIVNFDHQRIKRFDSKKLSMDEVLKAIRNAAGQNDWKLEPGDASGHIIATLLIRNMHTAVVEITYSPDEYSIDYKSSNNLDYKKYPDGKPFIGPNGQLMSGITEVIHPNYNKWVQQLNDAIYRALQD